MIAQIFFDGRAWVHKAASFARLGWLVDFESVKTEEDRMQATRASHPRMRSGDWKPARKHCYMTVFVQAEREQKKIGGWQTMVLARMVGQD